MAGVYLTALLAVPASPAALALGLFVPFSLGLEWFLQGRRAFCGTLGGDREDTGGRCTRGGAEGRTARPPDRRYAFRLTLLGVFGGGLLTVVTYAGLLLSG